MDIYCVAYAAFFKMKLSAWSHKDEEYNGRLPNRMEEYSYV